MGNCGIRLKGAIPSSRTADPPRLALYVVFFSPPAKRLEDATFPRGGDSAWLPQGSDNRAEGFHDKEMIPAIERRPVAIGGNGGRHDRNAAKLGHADEARGDDPPAASGAVCDVESQEVSGTIFDRCSEGLPSSARR